MGHLRHGKWEVLSGEGGWHPKNLNKLKIKPADIIEDKSTL